MEYVLPVVMLFLGLGIGAGGAWLLLRSRIDHAFESARSQSGSELAKLNERVEGREKTLTQVEGKLSEKEAEVEKLRQGITQQKATEAQLKQQLADERIQAQKQLEVLDAAQQKLSDAFKALASEALRSNNQSFLELAKTALESTNAAAKSDLENRHQAIDTLVKPVKESLDKVDQQIQRIERDRIGAYSGLTQQVSSLMDNQKELHLETSKLVKALRTPTIRGRWGEIQLKRVVELAGMLAHCDFYEQETANAEEGQKRPDVLVRLPGNKNIVVDAKVPLWGYLDAVEAADEESRKSKLLDHARQVRTHMMSLSKKAYFEQFEHAPEFVVLFLPGEMFFSAALEHDPLLIEFGAEQNVIIATPTTLIALLRAVAYGWRQERLAENAKEISDLGRDLYKRLSTLSDHFAKVGKGLDNAVQAYNQAVGSLEGRVLVSARRFQDLGITDEELTVLEPVEQASRLLQAPELLIESEVPDGLFSQAK